MRLSIRLLRPYLLVIYLLGTLLPTACQPRTPESAQTQQIQHRHTAQPTTTSRQRQTDSQIPQKVYDVLAYVRANGRAMDGYVGGRRFGNFEKHLPRSDPDGKPVQYQEWDVNPKRKGKNRGTERLITGSDRRAWYTRDHYNTFVEVN